MWKILCVCWNIRGWIEILRCLGSENIGRHVLNFCSWRRKKNHFLSHRRNSIEFSMTCLWWYNTNDVAPNPIFRVIAQFIEQFRSISTILTILWSLLGKFTTAPNWEETFFRLLCLTLLTRSIIQGRHETLSANQVTLSELRYAVNCCCSFVSWRCVQFDFDLKINDRRITLFTVRSHTYSINSANLLSVSEWFCMDCKLKLSFLSAYFFSCPQLTGASD